MACYRTPSNQLHTNILTSNIHYSLINVPQIIIQIMWFRVVQILLLATLINELRADSIRQLNATHCEKLINSSRYYTIF